MNKILLAVGFSAALLASPAKAMTADQIDDFAALFAAVTIVNKDCNVAKYDMDEVIYRASKAGMTPEDGEKMKPKEFMYLVVAKKAVDQGAEKSMCKVYSRILDDNGIPHLR
jgi:hypothetical protein